jgi:deoxyribonuclease V
VREELELLELPDLSQFTRDLLQQIPCGRVTTYQALAIALGDKIAARAIPQLIAPSRGDPQCPTHRVLASDGAVLGGSAIERAEKIQRLQAEGVCVRDGRVVPLSKYLFRDFRCEAPLTRLQRSQLEARQRLSLRPERSSYHTVGGIDLSYAGAQGVAAYVCLERSTLKLMRVDTEAQEVRFPYIPSYLAFRELPVMLALMRRLKETPRLGEITLVDGNGTLHQRHAGIASQLGVLLDVATIGITKSLLYGEPEKDLRALRPGEVCYIVASGEKLGAAIRSSPTMEPFFVSPGHKIDLESAIEIARACLEEGRLPEPIQLAHDASREAAQQLKAQRAESAKPAPPPKSSSQLGLFEKA